MTERKLLFRGFHPDENGKTTIILNGKKIRGEWIYWDIYGHAHCKYVRYMTCGNMFPCFVMPYDVLPETVGQWVTEDKNGKDLFDGDKVKDKNGNIYTICYHNFAWQLQEDLGESYAYSDLCFYVKDGGIELIGNKWENEVTE